MTAQQLIEALQKIDANRIVIISKDAEGNRYSPLSTLWEGSYRAETTYCGEIGLETLTERMKAAGYTEEDVMEDGVPAVVLTPIY